MRKHWQERRALVVGMLGVVFLVGVLAIPAVGSWLNENVGTTTAVAAVVGFVYAFLAYRQVADLAQRQRLDAMTPIIVFRFAGQVENGRFTVRVRNAGTGPALHLRILWRSRWKGEWRDDEPAITMEPLTLNTALGAGEEEELQFQIDGNEHGFFAERVVDPNALGNSPQDVGSINLGALHVSYKTLFGSRRKTHPNIEVRKLHQRRSGGAVETKLVPCLAEDSLDEQSEHLG